MPAALPVISQGLGPLASRTFAFSTAGDAANGLLPFGWSVTDFQTWTLVYLGVSSLAFVLVWVVGYLRR